MLVLKTGGLALALAAALFLAAAPSPAAPAADEGASAAAAAEAEWPQASSDLPADPEVRFGILPNGMRYAIRHNATPPGEASLRLRIDAGSLHEAENQRGLAHFLEHMVLNGTTNVPEGEFVRRLERHGLRFGPDTNASTGFTQTVYKLDLPETDAETVDTALFVLREVVDEAMLVTSAIDAERGIILSEERTRSTPGYRIFIDELGYMLEGQLAPDRLPIGRTEVIRTAPRDRFVEFYNAYYRPDRATLIAVGDFDVDEMEARIRAQFQSWRAEDADGSEPDLGSVAPRSVEARAVSEPGASERVSLAWLRPADSRPDTRAVRADKMAECIALDVLNRRLERIASTSAAPPFIAASSRRSDMADSAEIVQIRAVVRPGEWRQALEAVEQEQRRLVEHGITQAELDREIARSRTRLSTSVARAATRPSQALANAIADAIDDEEVFTDPAVNLAIFEESEGDLTSERIQRAAQALFQGSGPLLYLESSEPVEAGESALLGAYRQSNAEAVEPPAARDALAWPYEDFGAPGEVAERSEIDGEIGATAVRFANGVRLTVKPTDFSDDQILVQVRTGDGRWNVPVDGPDPSWAIGPGFVMGGLERISFEEMRDVLAGKTFGIGPGLYDDSFVLAGATRPEDFDTQMQVLAAYVAEPGWDPVGWNRVRATGETIHNRLEATPGGIYEREAAALLHSGDRRWARATREEIAASSIGEIRALLAEAFAREPIEVIVVGDVSVEEAIAQTAATFGALPQRIPEPDAIPVVRFPQGTAQPVRLTHTGRADQGLAMIAWPTPGFFADTADTRALMVLADVYRLRLIDRIREEQGTTYSPAARLVSSRSSDEFGFLFGRIEAPPAALGGFLTDAADIARDLAENPVTADELERARRPLIEGVQRSRTDNGGWMFMLADIQEDPRVARAIRSEVSDYQRITPESLRETARRFLRPDTAWKLVIVPEQRQTEDAATEDSPGTE